MIELAKHIERLLLENDCVIVPQFGGFVAHQAPAKWIAEEKNFLPPSRTLGFNPQLKINDGLLVQSYMQSYRVTFSEATRLIDQTVSELIRTLHQNGKVELYGIGEMSLSILGNYEFNPMEEGLITPYLYGLGSFEIKELADITTIQKIETAVRTKKENRQKDVYEIRISRSLLHHTVAAAAAILIFFFFSTPVANTYIDQTNYAELLPSELFESIKHKSMTMALKPIQKSLVATKDSEIIKSPQRLLVAKAENVAKREVKVEEVALQSIEKPTLKIESTVENEGKYKLIIASVVYEKDAQEIVNSYINKGFSQATIVMGSGRARVSLMSFSDKTAANQKIQQLKKDIAYKNIWLLAK